jgi:hypothetical protein
LYCERVPAAKLNLYNQACLDRLVAESTDAEPFRELVGRPPTSKITPAQ